MSSPHDYRNTVITDLNPTKDGKPAIWPELWPHLPAAEREKIIAFVKEGKFPEYHEVTSMSGKAELLRQVAPAAEPTLTEARTRLAAEIYAVDLTLANETHPEARESIRLRRVGMADAMCSLLEEGPRDFVSPETADRYIESEGAAYYQACIIPRVFHA